MLPPRSIAFREAHALTGVRDAAIVLLNFNNDRDILLVTPVA